MPTVTAPKQCGFGSVVMKEMAERSLDGKVDLDYAPSGLRWRLTCPAANALEAREPVASAKDQFSTMLGLLSESIWIVSRTVAALFEIGH